MIAVDIGNYDWLMEFTIKKNTALRFKLFILNANYSIVMRQEYFIRDIFVGERPTLVDIAYDRVWSECRPLADPSPCACVPCRSSSVVRLIGPDPDNLQPPTESSSDHHWLGNRQPTVFYMHDVANEGRDITVPIPSQFYQRSLGTMTDMPKEVGCQATVVKTSVYSNTEPDEPVVRKSSAPYLLLALGTLSLVALVLFKQK